VLELVFKVFVVDNGAVVAVGKAIGKEVGKAGFKVLKVL